MLQFSKEQRATSRELASDSISASEALQAIVSFFRRQSSVFLFTIFLTTALGVIYLLTARPMFTGQAQLLLDTHTLQALQAPRQLPFSSVPIAPQVESQVGLLKSENIASAVIEKLHLAQDPEFINPGDLRAAISSFVFGGFVFDDQAAPSEFELSRRAMDTFARRLTVTRVPQSFIIQIEFQSYDPERAAQIANAIADAYIIDQLEAKYKATRQAGGWLQDRIKELRAQVADAERAVVQFRTKHDIVSTGGGTDRPLLNQQQVNELSSQLTIARANTAEAQARLDRINSINKTDLSVRSLPDASFGATVTDTLKNAIITKLWGQYLDLAALERNFSAKYGPDHFAVVNLRDKMREIRKNISEELKRLGETFKSDYEIAKQREQELQKELASAVSKSQLTDVNTIALTELDSTAQSSKKVYENYLRRYMESVQEESFPISDARVISPATQPLSKSSPKTLIVVPLAALAGMVLGFGIGLWRDLSERVFRGVQQVESLLHVNCIALVPLAGPNRQKSNAGSSMPDASRRRQLETWLTRSLSFAYSFVRSSSSGSSTVQRWLSLTLASDANGRGEAVKVPASGSDQDAVVAPATLHSVADGQSETTKIPASWSDQDAEVVILPSAENELKLPGRKKAIARNDHLLWSVVDAPLSRFSEALRSIKLAIDLNGAFKANRVIGMTSTLPNEGKSTIAFSLAQLMAQVGMRTILVDCDLRNPSLSRALAPSAKRGLIDVLTEKVDFEKAILKDPSTNMIFLPAVMKYRFANSNEILSSVRMKNLFEKLRENYDYIVVDLPPLAPIVDVRAATSLVDTFIFVIEWGQTKIDVVEHALGQAQEVYDHLLGVVLNKVDMKRFARHAGDHGSYYYNQRYGRYGYTE